MSTTTHDAMYQTIGGDAGIKKVVDHFYERLWADPELQHYFDGIDRDKLKQHQKQVLIGAAVTGFVLGGGIAAVGGLFRRRR